MSFFGRFHDHGDGLGRRGEMGGAVCSSLSVHHAFGARLFDVLVFFPLSHTGSLGVCPASFGPSGSVTSSSRPSPPPGVRSIGARLTSNPYRSYCGGCMSCFLSCVSLLRSTALSFASDTCSLPSVPSCESQTPPGCVHLSRVRRRSGPPSPRIEPWRGRSSDRLHKRKDRRCFRILACFEKNQVDIEGSVSPSDLARGSRPPSWGVQLGNRKREIESPPPRDRRTCTLPTPPSLLRPLGRMGGEGTTVLP